MELLSQINWNGHLALVFDLDVGQLLSGSTRTWSNLRLVRHATSYDVQHGDKIGVWVCGTDHTTISDLDGSSTSPEITCEGGGS